METSMKRIFVTGAAGFIGFHLCRALVKRGDFVIGLDNFNHYYDPLLKEQRAAQLAHCGIEIIRGDICNQPLMDSILSKNQISHVAHLAAQAGVRHCIQHPEDYAASNLQGFFSVLEACRRYNKAKLIFASSSSVYGLNRKVPFSENDKTDQPANFYAATKKSNELMAFSYHQIYGLPITGLRYFTVYGPWGRPDMACYRFADKIAKGQPIEVFNHGQMKRDFTYIDDIIEGTLAAIDLGASYEIFNLGNHRSVELLHLIELLEQALQKNAVVQFLPMQPGEVLETFADIEKSSRLLHFHPKITLEEGVKKFIAWHQTYEQARQSTL